MKRMLVFMLALFCLMATVPVSADNSTTKSLFPDLQGHWAQETVNTMAMIKVFVGYPDGNFYPDQTVTRAEFLAALNRTVEMGLNLNYPIASVFTPSFNDVKPEDWFWDDVKKASERGWLNTDIGQAFHPNDPIPRKEMARIIARVASQMSVELPMHDSVLFTDVEKANPYFADIDMATRLGVLDGYPDAMFHPDGTLTRAEASTVILRTLQLDAPKSPFASDKFKGAWEPAKTADMFIFAGWEEAFTQKGTTLDLSAFRSFASVKAISQYQAYLEFVRKLDGIDPNDYEFWMGDFYPKYINNNVAIVSWYLSFDKKIGNQWYVQKTLPFTITIKRGDNRQWVVDDFPIQIPRTDQKEQSYTSPILNHLLTFRYQDPSGLYYGNIITGSITNPQQSEASQELNQIFSQSPGQIKVLRILGVPAEETSNALLVQQLEASQTQKKDMDGLHQLVVLRTGNWFDFTEGPSDKVLYELWGNFNYDGGQFIPLSIDGVPWTTMSDDPFWRKLQAYTSSQKVKDDDPQLSEELEVVLQKYKK